MILKLKDLQNSDSNIIQFELYNDKEYLLKRVKNDSIEDLHDLQDQLLDDASETRLFSDSIDDLATQLYDYRIECLCQDPELIDEIFSYLSALEFCKFCDSLHRINEFKNFDGETIYYVEI